MNIFLVIFIPVLLYMFYDFRKAFLIFAFLKIFLNQNINVVNIPGIPLLTLEFACNICFLFYFIRFKRKTYMDNVFPLKVIFRIVIISYMISSITSIVGFPMAFGRSLRVIINDFGFTFVLWYVLNSRKDIRLLLNGLIFVFVFLVIYGYFEKLTGLNPIYDYEVSLNPKNSSTDWDYSSGRLGMMRVRSATIHPIGFGATMSGLMVLFMIVSSKYKSIWKLSIVKQIFMMLVGISIIFFTNSRSPIVFLGVIFLPFFNLKKKSSYQFMFFSLIGLVLSFPIIQPYLPNVLSIFSSTGSTSKVGGSSIALRGLQFLTAINVAQTNPFFGMGVKSASILAEKNDSLMGMESIWLWLIIERGFFGVISHIVLLYSIFKLGYDKNKIYIKYLVLGWLLITTITSIPGCELSFFLTIVIIIIKSEYCENKENLNLKKSL